MRGLEYFVSSKSNMNCHQSVGVIFFHMKSACIMVNVYYIICTLYSNNKCPSIKTGNDYRDTKCTKLPLTYNNTTCVTNMITECCIMSYSTTAVIFLFLMTSKEGKLFRECLWTVSLNILLISQSTTIFRD